ncbi:hypothetical protein D3C80_964120 [compost metagenome]
MLHQFRQVCGALLGGLVLPVITQRVDADHRVAQLGHFPGHVAVQVTPAAIAGEEQGHGIGGLPGRHLDHRDAHGVAIVADQRLGQLGLEHLRQVDVVVADAGLGIRLITHEGRAGVIRVVVPGHAPVAVGGRLGQWRGAAGLLQIEVHRDCLGLVIALAGQPAPGLGRAWADTGNQRRSALELLQGLLHGLLLLAAIGGWEDQLDQLRFAALAQVKQLFLAQGLVLGHGDGDSRLGTGTWVDPDQAAAISQAQVLQGRLGCRAGP